MTRRRFTLETLAFAAIRPSRASCQTSPPSENIQSLLEKQLQDEHIPGIAAIAIRSHTIIGIAAAGVKRQALTSQALTSHAVERQPEIMPLQPADLFHLGSNTKAITAAMTARLVEAGNLSWTSTPQDFFPELNKSMHPAYKQITLEQLLSHHAGIPPWTKVKASPENIWPEPWPHLSGSAVAQRSQFAGTVLKHAPAITPGTKGLYSNAGFVIAAAMAERQTGSSWEDLITSQVLEPLGMHAIFGFPLTADVNQPWGHVETQRAFKAVPGGAIEMPPYMLPAGGMAMSLTHYARFLQVNLKGLRGEDTSFLSAKTVQRLHSSTLHDQYAMGWGVSQIDGVPSSVHNGSAGSFYALAALQPSRDAGVAVVLNSGGERSWQAADTVLTALLKEFATAAQ